MVVPIHLSHMMDTTEEHNGHTTIIILALLKIWQHHQIYKIELDYHYGILNTSGLARKLNTRISSVDADVQELIDAGIHVCIASGNRNLTIDVSGGPDYNNRYRVYPR